MEVDIINERGFDSLGKLIVKFPAEWNDAMYSMLNSGIMSGTHFDLRVASENYRSSKRTLWKLES